MTNYKKNNIKFKALNFKIKINQLIGHWSLGNWSLNKGFTLVELLIATAILGLILYMSGALYANIQSSVNNIRAANLVYEEARFTMERMVKEVRAGSIDYEEYYNQANNYSGTGENKTLGTKYCFYSRQFYSAGLDGEMGTYDDESLGKRNPDNLTNAPIQGPAQDKLFLINTAGNQRTYIKWGKQNGIGKVGMLKMTGKDYGMDHIDSATGGLGCARDTGERDGLIDTWFCDKGFNCTAKPIAVGLCSGTIDEIKDSPDTLDQTQTSFLDITPPTLDITELKFYIAPMDDPRKAYNEPLAQIQPHVTIKMRARAVPEIALSFKGERPDIVLETTVTARAQKEIVTECSLVECLSGQQISPCPKGGVAAGAFVTCAQGSFPECTEQVYLEQTIANMIVAGITGGLDKTAPFDTYVSSPYNGAYTFYEPLSEIGSCATIFSGDDTKIAACKDRRCSDTYDNDGNGKADVADSACLYQMCNNGIRDPDPANVGAYLEECIDVGGICSGTRPTQTAETICDDGYDNDCNGFADEFDQNCINIICDNKVRDFDIFVNQNYMPKNYLVRAPIDKDSTLDEQCINIGGLCANSTLKDQQYYNNETGDLCYDGLDNDCDYNAAGNTGGADEFDSDNDCALTICSNNDADKDLLDSALLSGKYSAAYSAQYLVGYADPFNITDSSSNDEACIDRGGICSSLGKKADATEYETSGDAGCSDGVDNDCDGKIDSKDTDCCPDSDGDGFSPKITGTPDRCNPDNAEVAGGAGKIDCNDSDPAIKPGAPEVCDGALYPQNTVIDYGGGKTTDLSFQPIDNNCSGINGLDNGTDLDDPECASSTLLMPFIFNPRLPDSNTRALWSWKDWGNLKGNSAAIQAYLAFLAAPHSKSEYKINRLFLFSEDVMDYASADDKKQMQDFLKAANQNNLIVEYLTGDPNWVKTDQKAAIENRCQRVIDFNKLTPNDTADDFKGIHFDIEPYTLPEWTQDFAKGKDKYNDTYENNLLEGLVKCKNLILQNQQNISLTLDAPTWYHKDATDLWTPLTASDSPVDFLTIMNFFDAEANFLHGYAGGGDKAGGIEFNLLASGSRLLMFGAETQDLGLADEVITFFEEGYLLMESVFSAGKTLYGSNPHFAGYAIHYSTPYETMISAP